MSHSTLQVPVRSEHSDILICGRCRVLACRLAHVVCVSPSTIILSFCLMLLTRCQYLSPAMFTPKHRNYDSEMRFFTFRKFILSHGPGDVSGKCKSGNCAAPDFSLRTHLVPLPPHPHPRTVLTTCGSQRGYLVPVAC